MNTELLYFIAELILVIAIWKFIVFAWIFIIKSSQLLTAAKALESACSEARINMMMNSPKPPKWFNFIAGLGSIVK